MTMLDITPEDINALNDTDFRTLVGKLCEADFPNKSCITWGGHQKAPDGGIDVRVELSCAVEPDGFIPRAFTRFQVKDSDMPSSEIKEEMRPKNVLRPVIGELANVNGAYIIVSSRGWTADKPLQDRKQAMRDALSDLPNAADLTTDFYDRSRVASWVRCHPSLILWVKEKIGHATHGWHSYGNWANGCTEANEDYLLDDGLRVHDDSNKTLEGMKAEDGINALRQVLSLPKKSVRLVGLSGVGKTRLVQALFDERVGTHPLPTSQVYYADMGDSPNPPPAALAEQLRALKKTAILIIDNCPPTLHSQLTKTCAMPDSLIRLITVEYDIKEDQPEQTDVFRLEAASPELVEKIIAKRFPAISQLNTRTIAEFSFSGGNARIAIALANTVLKDDNLSTLKDVELFNRLFQQRNDSDDNLLQASQVCALIYSFDAETENSELAQLAALADTTPQKLHRAVVELKRRDLVQKRSVWRAVLPHAIANRLAKQALENILPSAIRDTFERAGSERLLQSFSRRLSYLHDSEQAVSIAKRWLSEQGFLNNVSHLNNLDIALLKNIAPIAPKETLAAIERAANGEQGQRFISRSYDNPHRNAFTQLLIALAYDADLFERCTRLLCRFALSEKPTENSNAIRPQLKILFSLYLSGTHATAQQRLNIIKYLVATNSESEQQLALLLLDGALNATYFNGHHQYDFGAHSRDYGYHPETRDEVTAWFSVFIRYAEQLAISNHPIATPVRALLAKSFQWLWLHTEAWDVLETMAQTLVAHAAWNEGWIAVKATLNAGAKEMRPDLLVRLQNLEALLKPSDLLELARTYAFADYDDSMNLVDDAENDDEESWLKKDEQSKQIKLDIAKQVAMDETVFNTLLPELLMVSTNSNGLFYFGQGLAEGCANYLAIWQKFRQQLSVIDIVQRKYAVLCGFIHGVSLKNPAYASQILDEAVSDEVLGVCFPKLQLNIQIDEQGVERLKQSLENNLAPTVMYQNLVCAVHLADSPLCEILRSLATKPDGFNIAIRTLKMRLINVRTHSEVIIALGRELLTQIDFKCAKEMDYDLSVIADKCLVGESAVIAATEICENFAEVFVSYQVHSFDYESFLASLVKQQPKVFLDSFVKLPDFEIVCSPISCINDENSKLLSQIADQVLLDWCAINPAIRYPQIAAHINFASFNQQTNCLEWRPLALTIMDNAPNVVDILNSFKQEFFPNSWNGSLANIMAGYLPLITQLKSHETPAIANWAHQEEPVYSEQIQQERQWEEQHNRRDNERFE